MDELVRERMIRAVKAYANAAAPTLGSLFDVHDPTLVTEADVRNVAADLFLQTLLAHGLVVLPTEDV